MTQRTFEWSLLGVYILVGICVYAGLDIVCAILSLAVMIIILCCMRSFR